ncbi:hypothetical protein Fot_04152 [Forsythia ovata]|uniref:Uncharacterized protein n=1 Tax=Forsythia ovata TaxID=205694 RepID=A0ABD1XER6_9LAMI
MMKTLTGVQIKNQEMSLELVKMKSHMSSTQQELCRSNEESIKQMSKILSIQQHISSDVTDTMIKLDSMMDCIQEIQKSLKENGLKQRDCLMIVPTATNVNASKGTGTIPAASMKTTPAAPLKRISKPGRCLLSPYLPNNGSSLGSASKLSDDTIVFKEELASSDNSNIVTFDD